MTHICINDLTIIGSDNGLSPGRRQAIIRTNAGKLLIRPLGTTFSEILIEILIFSFKKMCLKVSSAERRPFCLGLNVLIHVSGKDLWRHLRLWGWQPSVLPLTIKWLHWWLAWGLFFSKYFNDFKDSPIWNTFYSEVLLSHDQPGHNIIYNPAMTNTGNKPNFKLKHHAMLIFTLTGIAFLWHILNILEVGIIPVRFIGSWFPTELTSYHGHLTIQNGIFVARVMPMKPTS